jgi:Domain of unknown function (DUF1127)
LRLVISLKREIRQGDRYINCSKFGEFTEIAVKRLRGLDERMLNDIGLTRNDVLNGRF